MADEIAIRVENVSKDFILPHEKVSSVKGLFTGLTKGLNRTKETQHALRDISFEIKKGEFFGIVGRNGSGKSTLLKILAGIYQPTRGKTYTQGKLVPFIELGVGFNPELTGRENIFLNGAMLGFSRSEIEAMYDSIVEFAELERFMDQKLKNYSSGMQVRLAFSMAVRAEADVLLIDEVLAVGDADFQRKCYNYFKQLKRDQKTVVFVSHDMEAIREYCDRALLIDNSKVSLMGNTREVAEAYTKLFTAKATDSNKVREEQSRWGDGRAFVRSINAEVADDYIKIQQQIEASDEVDGLIVGFRLRDSAGVAITGTNSKLEGRHVPTLSAGQTILITWRILNVMSDGQYSVDPAILHADGITVADWWDEAIRFTVKKSRRLPYPIDPEFELVINKD